ncbi:MAG: hypothetical protein RL095_1983 [Verrucomicrobiota bacterium]|jgi:alpha-L-fucosidase
MKTIIASTALLLAAQLAAAPQPWEMPDSAPAATPRQEIHPLLRLAGPYTPDDQSLAKHRTPAWFTEAKVGLSMHWGVYAVPGWAPRGVGIGDSYAEWYGNKLKTNKHYQDYHAKTWGKDFRYDDFIPLFKAEHFDADAWMKTLKDAGVKYYFITAKHHDGFCLWDSALTGRNAMKMGPKRDLLGELAAAARRHGLKFGFYYSLYEWDNPLYLREHAPRKSAEAEAAIAAGAYTGLIPKKSYVDDFMIPQLVELVSKYQPDLLYFDGEWDHPEPFWRMRQFAAWYYNQAAARGQEVLLNDRFGKGLRGKAGDLSHVEYGWGVEAKGGQRVWAEWRGLAHSFGYNRNEAPEAYLQPAAAIRMMVDAVSDNGNIEFNVGPRSDGSIPEADLALIQSMGAWLKVNGEAIYGASRSPLAKPAWGRLTARPDKNRLYLHVYQWPADGRIVLSGLPADTRVAKASLLAEPPRQITASRLADGSLLVQLSGQAPDAAASVVALEFQP